MTAQIYAELAEFAERPALFSRYTTDQLWTDPHIGRQMLAFHLDESHDLASRRGVAIDGFVDWIDRRLTLAGRRVLDIGCGPGLYSQRMARRGAQVTGLDFSAISISHARASAAAAGLAITYNEGDYLKDALPGPADLVTLIYGDYCAIAPERRRRLLDAVRATLAPGGVFVFDLFSPGQRAAIAEGLSFGRRFMGGFWAEGDYFGFRAGFHYPDQEASLERFRIATPGRQFEIFNWMQYFSPASIRDELRVAGWRCEGPFAFETGADWAESASPFVMLARP